jgi:hypothetical protein
MREREMEEQKLVRDQERLIKKLALELALLDQKLGERR